MTLENVTRCLLAVTRPDGEGPPMLIPAPCWSDGDALWCALPAIPAAALREAPACVLGVFGLDGAFESQVVAGAARVFGPGDPVALLVHGPLISAAMIALALRNPREMSRSVGLLPVRILIGAEVPNGVARVAATGPGIAPPLPAVVPADIRRRLSGLRGVLVATAEGGGPRLDRAVWGAGFTLHGDLPDGPTTRVVVAVTDGPTGVALTGRLLAGKLAPTEVAWWDSLGTGSAAVEEPTRGAVQLPD